jgi:hypothetical protein
MNSPTQQSTNETRRIICLANSRKNNGRCIAGIENIGTKEQKWIRPVSASPTGEIPEPDCAYSLANPIRVLDVIDVSLLGPSPKKHQSENWIIAGGRPWLYRGRVDYSDVLAGISTIQNLWADGESSGKGLNDRISESAIDQVSDSLMLIKVERIDLEVNTVYGAMSGSDIRARFHYGKADYALKVTDPAYERSFRGKPSGHYPLGPAFLTVSLTEEPFKGHFYKLVAAIIEIKGN